MKKWNNPELMILGVEDTEDTCDGNHYVIIDGIMQIDSNKHPCHKTGNGEHNNNGNHDGDGGNNVANPGQQGHVVSVGCPDHKFCCCYALS